MSLKIKLIWTCNIFITYNRWSLIFNLNYKKNQLFDFLLQTLKISWEKMYDDFTTECTGYYTRFFQEKI
jgi:hypothetical protein